MKNKLKKYIPNKYLKHLRRDLNNSPTYLHASYKHTISIETEYTGYGANARNFGLFYKDVQLSYENYSSLEHDVKNETKRTTVLKMFDMANDINNSPILREILNIKPFKSK